MSSSPIRIVLHPRHHGAIWDVEHAGELIVIGARDPEHQAARALQAAGFSGPFETVGEDGRVRMRFRSIAGAAKLTVSDRDDGARPPSLARWVPFRRGQLKDAFFGSGGTQEPAKGKNDF